MMAKQVVILGAGASGIATAHKLLKHTAPKIKDLKVVLVSPNTHFFWNPAIVRGLVPDEIPDDKMFIPIAPNFAHYPINTFQLVRGLAERIDTARDSVAVKSDKGLETIPYDYLVIATGSNVGSVPVKHLGDHEFTIGELHKLQHDIKAAKSIVVAGAGASGIETVAELGLAYGKTKDITLIVRGDRILTSMRRDLSETGEAALEATGVELIRNASVTKSSKDGPQTVITLSTGQKLNADVYLPLTGVCPNTSFLPEQWLDGDGNVKVNPHLRVEGTENVYAIGDVCNLEAKTLLAVETQFSYLGDELDAVLEGKAGAVTDYNVDTNVRQFVSLGKWNGLGQYNSWKIFGFLVGMMKGRTLFVETAPKIVQGKQVIRTKV
ncbi:hypothetical protein FOVSG1_011128 [Fusarium oxysporum f. sp. vasinfectum]